jgi:hypothetical protein
VNVIIPFDELLHFSEGVVNHQMSFYQRDEQRLLQRGEPKMVDSFIPPIY